MQNQTTPEAPTQGKLQRWCLVSNCQAIGLANCFTLLTDQIILDSFDPPTFSQNKEGILDNIDSYDRVLVAPWVERTMDFELGGRENVWRLPTMDFDAYQPDLCNLLADGQLLGGPLSGNFSAISYAAFRCGLNVKQAIELYREETYAELGYLDRWDTARFAVIEQFRQAGYDLTESFIKWSRQGPFAYIPSHPKIACLRDIAKVVLTRAGINVADTDALPHDNLSNGAHFPVYPEIGARLGIAGNYLFKPPMEYRFMGLQEFVEKSFAFFRQSKELVHTRPFEKQVSLAISVIAGSK